MHTNLKRFGILAAIVLAPLFIPANITAAATHDTTSHMMGATTVGSTTKVMVMKHLCNANIKNLADFEALEAGRSPVAALANTVLNCPTTGLVGDEAATGTVSSPRESFAFTISGAGMPAQTLGDATFENGKVCESNINIDVNSDGTTSPATCLDISHYAFALGATTNGDYVVTETSAPANRHFGTLRLTPTELAMNNDAASLQSIDAANGKIYLRTNSDTDKMVMLHIYNFVHGTTTVEDDDDDDEMGHDGKMCHGHDASGNMVWMTAGDDHGHDMNGKDVQMEHYCATDRMDMDDSDKLEEIEQLYEQMMMMQMKIIKFLKELLASH